VRKALRLKRGSVYNCEIRTPPLSTTGAHHGRVVAVDVPDGARVSNALRRGCRDDQFTSTKHLPSTGRRRRCSRWSPRAQSPEKGIDEVINSPLLYYIYNVVSDYLSGIYMYVGWL